MRDQLKTGLSGNADPEKGPKVAELAERIKSLRATHTVEPTLPRAGNRKSLAEEPVTTRIRRNLEAEATALHNAPIASESVNRPVTGTDRNNFDRSRRRLRLVNHA